MGGTRPNGAQMSSSATSPAAPAAQPPRARRGDAGRVDLARAHDLAGQRVHLRHHRGRGAGRQRARRAARPLPRALGGQPGPPADQDPAALHRSVDEPGEADAAEGAGRFEFDRWCRGRSRRPGGDGLQLAHHRLRRPADGLLQRLEGRGRQPRQPGRHQHGGHQGPRPQVRQLRRGDHLRGRQDRHRLRLRRRPRSQPPAHGLPAAQRPDVLAALRSAVLGGRQGRPVHDPPRGGARDHRLGRRRRPDVLARRVMPGRRTTNTTRVRIAIGRTTTPTTPSKR